MAKQPSEVGPVQKLQGQNEARAQEGYLMAKREEQPRSARRGAGLARISPRAPNNVAGLGKGARIWSWGQPMAVLGRGGGAVGAGGDAPARPPRSAPPLLARASPCREATVLGREGVRPRRTRARPIPRRDLAGTRS